MTNDDKIRDKTSTKISPLSSDKIDKYKYLIGDYILPSKKINIIQQAKLAWKH